MDNVDKNALFGEIESPAPKPSEHIQLKQAPGARVEKELAQSEELETEAVEKTLKLRIIQVASGSKGFFRHQQKDEPDLTRQEKKRIAGELLETKPALFLQRFGTYLSEDHLEYFEDLGADENYEVEFFLREARQQQCKFVREQKVKNRRFRAMQQMIRDGDEHFSEESMRQRQPLLYHQLIRQHQTEEERAEADRPDMSNCSLANIIMEHIDIDRERELKKRLAEDENVEEFDSESEDDDEDESPNTELQEEDRMSMRKEFVEAAYHSFLAGTDAGVDYKKIDTDSNLDDLILEDMETEERYFEEDSRDE